MEAFSCKGAGEEEGIAAARTHLYPGLSIHPSLLGQVPSAGEAWWGHGT